MTTIEKMRAGRERQLAALHEDHVAQVAAYREWSRTDAWLFAFRRTVSEELGRDSSQFEASDMAWKAHMRMRPVPPPDSSRAWGR